MENLKLKTTYGRARALVAQGLFIEAVPEFKKCLEADSSLNINPMLDLAGCYYGLGDYLIFRKYTQQALEVFNAFDLSKLQSEDDYHGAILGLGRGLEELGMVHEALTVFSRSIDNSTSIRKKKILAERLRLQCELNINIDDDRGLSAMTSYQSLCPDGNVEVDIINAILYFEFRESGMVTAMREFFRLSSHDRFIESDRRLLLFNLLYLSLLNQGPIDKGLVSACLDFDYFGCDPYEKCLYDYLLAFTNANPLNEVSPQRGRGLSPMCRLRFLYLLTLNPHHTEGVIAQRLLRSSLEGLSVKSKDLLLGAFRITEKSGIVLTLAGSVLNLESKSLNLEGSRSQLQILRLFAGRNTVSMEQFCQRIFESEIQEGSLKRIGMALGRLNRSVSSVFGLEKIILLSKYELNLNPLVRIEIE